MAQECLTNEDHEAVPDSHLRSHRVWLGWTRLQRTRWPWPSLPRLGTNSKPLRIMWRDLRGGGLEAAQLAAPDPPAVTAMGDDSVENQEYAKDTALKVYQRLLQQGRPEPQARRDAEAWVQGQPRCQHHAAGARARPAAHHRYSITAPFHVLRDRLSVGPGLGAGESPTSARRANRCLSHLH